MEQNKKNDGSLLEWWYYGAAVMKHPNREEAKKINRKYKKKHFIQFSLIVAVFIVIGLLRGYLSSVIGSESFNWISSIVVCVALFYLDSKIDKKVNKKYKAELKEIENQ